MYIHQDTSKSWCILMYACERASCLSFLMTTLRLFSDQVRFQQRAGHAELAGSETQRFGRWRELHLFLHLIFYLRRVGPKLSFAVTLRSNIRSAPFGFRMQYKITTRIRHCPPRVPLGLFCRRSNCSWGFGFQGQANPCWGLTLGLWLSRSSLRRSRPMLTCRQRVIRQLLQG